MLQNASATRKKTATARKTRAMRGAASYNYK